MNFPSRYTKGLFERLTPAIIGERAMIARHLEELESERTAAGQSSPACISTLSPEAIEERYCRPKSPARNCPINIIPIKATWAAQLFDPVLARSELFGAFARLALNRENVNTIEAPGLRVWWRRLASSGMFCQDAGAEGTMAMRACSRLLSLETGPAKELFKRHQRIGIYQWRDILETADGNPFNAIMAIRFADSEPFTQVVPVEFVRNLGINSQFQSPTRITEEQVYRDLQTWHEDENGMNDTALLLSIKPRYADSIFNGSKTVELRRVRPQIGAGGLVMVYVSSPRCSLEGAFEVAEVTARRPQCFGGWWERTPVLRGRSSMITSSVEISGTGFRLGGLGSFPRYRWLDSERRSYGRHRAIIMCGGVIRPSRRRINGSKKDGRSAGTSC